MNPEQQGTKVAAHYRHDRDPASRRRSAATLESRPRQTGPDNGECRSLRPTFDEIFRPAKGGGRVLCSRHPAVPDADAANVMRQALPACSGASSSIFYDVDKWLEERGSDPAPSRGIGPRATRSGTTCINGDIISMPDKWEYPWYAAWDLAFHALALRWSTRTSASSNESDAA